MSAFVIAACGFTAVFVLSLLLIVDASMRARLAEDARARRRARVFRLPSLASSRTMERRRHATTRDVAFERRHAA